MLRLLEPWRALTRPVFQGIDEIPEERPLLFVGNHTLFGVLDSPLMFAELYTRRGILLRGLGDHWHFRVPLWRDLLSAYGCVDGTRENCARLMESGECVLVYPGGGREVAKRKGEQYQLIWKERLGFARMAIAHRCTIIPFAAVGVEHAYDILIDADDIMASPLGPLLKRLRVRTEVIMPIARGLGGTPLPRPERFYFRFGPAIPTAPYQGDTGEESCRALRDQVKAQVEASIAALLQEREQDPARTLLPQRLRRGG